MDKFCLIAIMLFAIQRDMVNYSITCVIKCIDEYRGTMSRVDYLKLVFEDAVYEYNVHNASFGVYDKYLCIQQIVLSLNL